VERTARPATGALASVGTSALRKQRSVGWSDQHGAGASVLAENAAGTATRGPGAPVHPPLRAPERSGGGTAAELQLAANQLDGKYLDTTELYDVLGVPKHVRSELGDELMVHGFNYHTLTYVLIVKHSLYFIAVVIICVFLVFAGNDGPMQYHRYSWYREA